MHVTTDISVGNLITLVVTTCALVFGAGRLTQVLNTLAADFKDHQKEDLDTFNGIRETLMEILVRQQTGHHKPKAVNAPGDLP